MNGLNVGKFLRGEDTKSRLWKSEKKKNSTTWDLSETGAGKCSEAIKFVYGFCVLENFFSELEEACHPCQDVNEIKGWESN